MYNDVFYKKGEYIDIQLNSIGTKEINREITQKEYKKLDTYSDLNISQQQIKNNVLPATVLGNDLPQIAKAAAAAEASGSISETNTIPDIITQKIYDVVKARRDLLPLSTIIEGSDLSEWLLKRGS